MIDDHCCAEMCRHCADREVAILYVDKLREYGIQIRSCSAAYQLMRYCPWCGGELPASLRNEWFDRLDKLGKEPDDVLPEELLSDGWWKSEGL